MRTIKGIFPGIECVAQPKHGSYDLKAISFLFSVPSDTSTPFLINPRAALLIDIDIGALLFVVPTMRLTLFRIPLSSVV